MIYIVVCTFFFSNLNVWTRISIGSEVQSCKGEKRTQPGGRELC